MARCLRTDDGYMLLARTNGVGAWCGYVGLPDGHPWHGTGYDSLDVDVHGGLTYAEEHAPVDVLMELELSTGAMTPSWWLGFDCAHAGDYVPGVAGMRGTSGRVWTLEDVWTEIENLLAQVRSAL